MKVGDGMRKEAMKAPNFPKICLPKVTPEFSKQVKMLCKQEAGPCKRPIPSARGAT